MNKISYLGGIIDGEGSISICRRKFKDRPSLHYFVELTIVNTDLLLMEWLKNNFGGSYYARRVSSDKHKVSYSWRVSQEKAKILLVRLLPHLIIKRQRALIAIKLQKSKTGSTKKIMTDLLAKREILYTEMKTLNKRGPSERHPLQRL